jgi:hypothetical protein
MATYAQAKAMLRIYSKKLLGYKNVVAVGLGRKNGDRRRKVWCIRIHVAKMPAQGTRNPIPPLLRPPRGSKWLAPVPTDVEQVGRVELHASGGPIESGTGVVMGEKGTCTALFADGNLYYALTCGHVASENLTGLHNLPWGYLDSFLKINCSLLNGTGQPVSGSVGQCVRCSSKQCPIDLALVQIDTSACLPQGSPYMSAIRRLNSAPLQPDEPITVIRRDDHGGLFNVSIPPALDHYVTTSFDYPTQQGDQTVTYAGLICYPAKNNASALQAGDSGSAVVDSKGLLIGVHIGASDDATKPVGYGVSSDQLMSWAPTLKLVPSANS